METKCCIQLLTKGDNYDENMPHKQPLDESTTSTLYDYKTATTVKDNTHIKYETTANVSNHKITNILTIIWLQYVCKNWYLTLMVLLTYNWYLPQWDTSIHSSNNIHLRQCEIKSTHFTENYYTIYKSEGKFQPQSGNRELIISRVIQKLQESMIKKKIISQTKDKSSFEIYWRGPHKADPKKIEETATQGSYLLVDSSTTCKTHSHREGITSQNKLLSKRNTTQTKRCIPYFIDWRRPKFPLRSEKPILNGQLVSRTVTELPTLIIPGTALRAPVTELNWLLLGRTTSFSLLPKVIQPKLCQGLRCRRITDSQRTSQFSSNDRVIESILSGPDSKVCRRAQHLPFSSVFSNLQVLCRLQHKIKSRCIAVQYSRTRLEASNMKLTPKDKGKSVMTRSIDEIVFNTDMAALDYEPSREEETFLQLIGLDRFVTRVTWEILNPSVMQEVITNLDVETMHTKLNGNIIPIFGKAWRQKMRAVFYLNTFLAKREPGTPRVHATDLFPNIKEKMKNKLGTCRINSCTVPEARKPLKFFNSLFLLRTSANTISCSAIAHIQDALNGKEVDWPALFSEYIKAELITLKEELYKDKTTNLRTLVGPPVTMLLNSEGLLTIQQELDAGILIPSELTETPACKKRKLELPESSKE